jgi:hypothetical protein
MSENDYKQRLLQARASAQRRNLVNDAKTLAQSATPWGAASLLKYAFQADFFLYAAALFAAILKDLLDWIGIGSLPAIGTIITICVSIFIFLMLLLAGSSSKIKIASKIVRRYLILGLGTLVEFLFGLNFLPVLTLTVIVIWLMALAEKKQEAEARKRQQSLTEEYA